MRKFAIQEFIRTEKFIVFLMAMTAILFNLLPYVYEYRFGPPDKIYVGSYPIIGDKPTYMAEMLQGQEGNWKLIDKYTTEPQNGAYIYTFYMLLGHIARITGLSLEAIFFLSRFFFGIILLITVIYFIQRFVVDKNQRIFAYFFAFFASGLGWLTRDEKSLDIWIPDNVPMAKFSYFPHIMVSEILILLAVLFIFRMFEAKNAKHYAVAAGISSLLLNFILPFSGIFLYILILLFLAILYLKNKPLIARNLGNIFIFFALSIPSLLFMYYIGTNDPVWSEVERQNILPTPSLASIASGYGLILVFVAVGLRVLYRKNNVKSLFFLAWTLTVPLLAYVPIWIYPMQRRFLETVFYAPIAIVGSFGAKKIYDSVKDKITGFKSLIFFSFLAILCLLFLTIGNVQNWAVFQYVADDANNLSFYLPAENIKAMEWLSINSPAQTIVLASFYNGNVIPYYANRFVYAGHGPETLNLPNKVAKVENFYSGKLSSREIYDFLKDERINYVFYSSVEKKLGSFDPDNYDFLTKAYQDNNVNVYRFEDNRNR